MLGTVACDPFNPSFGNLSFVNLSFVNLSFVNLQTIKNSAAAVLKCCYCIECPSACRFQEGWTYVGHMIRPIHLLSICQSAHSAAAVLKCCYCIECPSACRRECHLCQRCDCRSCKAVCVKCEVYKV